MLWRKVPTVYWKSLRLDRGGAAIDRESGGEGSAVAAEGEGHGGAHFTQTLRRQLAQAAAEGLLVDGHDVVEVGRAGLTEAVLRAESHFGWDTPDRRRDGSHRHAGKIRNRASTGQDEDRALLIRRRKTVKPDLASLIVRPIGHLVPGGGVVQRVRVLDVTIAITPFLLLQIQSL